MWFLFKIANGLLCTEFFFPLKLVEKPIAAPLQKISIANCRLASLPDFGVLPDLYHLNISYNQLDQITPQQFSPYCSLSNLVIENSTHLTPCMCKTLKIYFDRRHIELKDTFDCPLIRPGKWFSFFLC